MSRVRNNSNQSRMVQVKSWHVLEPGQSIRGVEVDLANPLPEGVMIVEDLSEVHPRLKANPTDEKKDVGTTQKLND